MSGGWERRKIGQVFFSLSKIVWTDRGVGTAEMHGQHFQTVWYMDDSSKLGRFSLVLSASGKTGRGGNPNQGASRGFCAMWFWQDLS